MQHHRCCTGGSGNSTKDNVLVVVPGEATTHKHLPGPHSRLRITLIVKKFYWSDNDFLLDDDVVVVDVLGQIVPVWG